MELFEYIQTLNAAHGPSGDEGEVRETITRLAAPYADEVTTDTLGNLIVQKKGSGPRVMLWRPHGLHRLYRHPHREGGLPPSGPGGRHRRPARLCTPRYALKTGCRGVFAKEEKAELKGLKLDSCYVDIGAADQEAAKKLVQVGDTAVYDTPAIRNGDKVISPYLDNRIACAVLLDVLARLEDCPNDLYLVFSVQEEVGLRGAKTAAWAIDPDYALAVDVTDVDDTPGSRALRHRPAGQGCGHQGDGFLRHLSPRCDLRSGGGCQDRKHSRPEGHYAGRGHRCRRHPHHPPGRAHRRGEHPLPDTSTPPWRWPT